MIILSVRVLQGFLEKSRGLIGASTAYPILFKTRFGIHTVGVRFPIDVLILNQGNVVVKMISSLEPNHFFFWPFWYDTVIELPGGDIQRQGITIGKAITIHQQ